MVLLRSIRKNKTGVAFIASLVMLLFNCTPQSSQAPQWQIVYQNDLNGKALSGSKAELADALKLGSPIRIAWGEKLPDGTSCIEFAQPDFTSLMNDSAVVVQVPLSFIQTNYIHSEKSFLKTNPPTGWRALLSTDGHYHQFHYDLASGEIIRVMYSRTNMTWYALIDKDANTDVPVLAKENTFALDSVIRK